MEEVKKLCLSIRRNAKDERVLFHYNGHGVPRPTSNGEISFSAWEEMKSRSTIKDLLLTLDMGIQQGLHTIYTSVHL